MSREFAQTRLLFIFLKSYYVFSDHFQHNKTMEDTYSLISKLVQTKSIEHVLSPIAVQVSQLIIINEAYENGDKDAFPDDLVPSALRVMQATQGLVEAVTRLVQSSNDEILKNEMPKACEDLSVAGNNLVTATQRVQIENYSAPSRKYLIRTAKDTLEATLKVFLASDDAEIRKIKKCIESTRQCLGLLTGVRSMKTLVPTFKSFAESVMLLRSQIDKRQLELSDPRQREALVMSLNTLKKCIPMLNTSLQTYVKYSDNPQAEASKLYVIGQIIECLDSLESVIQSKDSVTEDYEEPETPGHFVSNVDRILSLLSGDKPIQLADLGSELDTVIEALIRHTMAVAHLAPHLHRTKIIKSAQQLLKLRSEMCELNESLTNNQRAGMVPEFDSKCQSMITEAQHLESLVNSTTLWLVIDVFKESSEPLERLIKVMLTDDKKTQPLFSFDDFENEFHHHFDKMVQVARFAAATSVDARKVRNINSCISGLDHIDPEIMPAIQACRNSPGDQAAIEHLRLLKNEWINTLNVLVHTLDELIDGQMFIEVSESDMRNEADKCKQSKVREMKLVRDVTRSLVGKARRVAQRAMGVVENEPDAMHRSGIRAYVNKLNKAIAIFKSAANSVMEDFNNPQSHDKLHKRCEVLLKCTTLVKDGILKNSFPDVMDPDRIMSAPSHQDQDELFPVDDDDVHLSAKGKTVNKSDKPQLQQSSVLNTYLSGIIHNEIRELTSQLLSAAIGGHKQKLEMLNSSLIGYSNHLVESANRVTKCISCETDNKMLREGASNMSEYTSQILDKTSKVADCNTYEIESLHQVIDTWTTQVSNLESKLDVILLKWRQIPDKLLDAVKLSNEPLLAVQIDNIREHQVHVIQMITEAQSLAEHMDVVMIQKVSSLKDEAKQLEELTSDIINMAENQIKQNLKGEQHLELKQASRSWAAMTFYLVMSLDKLCADAMLTYIHRVLDVDGADCTKLNQHISTITELNIRLKSYIEGALLGCIIEKYIDDGQAAMNELDSVSVDITECYSILTGVMIPSNPLLLMYSPHQMNLLLWKWAKSVDRTKTLLNKWTSHCTGHIDRFVQAVITLHDSSKDDAQKPDVLTCKKYLEMITEVFLKARGKVLDLLQSSDSSDGKNAIRRHLENWASITEELQTIGKSLLDDLSEIKSDEFSFAKMQWGVKCLEIDGCLKSLAGIKHDSLPGFVRSLTCEDSTQTKNWKSCKNLSSTGLKCELSSTKRSNGAELAAKKPARDSDWRKLASYPKVQHTTPERPSEKSGYKPSSVTNKASPFCRLSECEQWQDDNNAIVKVAREISEQLRNMADYTKGCGPISNKEQLISVAKQVATNGAKLVKFAKILVKYSTDKRVAEDLQCSADYIPTVIAQLNILASVKAASPDDRSTEKMLVKTGDNLLDAINKMLRYAEAACVKGLKQNSDVAADETEALILATRWRHRFQRHRLMEYTTATVDRLGLRRVNHHTQAPALSNIMTTK